jgi:hypothetical protein
MPVLLIREEEEERESVLDKVYCSSPPHLISFHRQVSNCLEQDTRQDSQLHHENKVKERQDKKKMMSLWNQTI